MELRGRSLGMGIRWVVGSSIEVVRRCFVSSVNFRVVSVLVSFLFSVVVDFVVVWISLQVRISFDCRKWRQ